MFRELEQRRARELAKRPTQPSATTSYQLWLCVGYADAARTAIIAIDVVSADSSDAAARAFYQTPELAYLCMATIDVRLVASGRLDRAWRLLRYAPRAQGESP